MGSIIINTAAGERIPCKDMIRRGATTGNETHGEYSGSGTHDGAYRGKPLEFLAKWVYGSNHWHAAQDFRDRSVKDY